MASIRFGTLGAANVTLAALLESASTASRQATSAYRAAGMKARGT